MTILIGTDLSKTCAPIADIAAELAQRRDEELVVAHVVDGPLLPKTIPAQDAAIDAEARRLRSLGCRVRAVLLHDGPPGKRLADLAEQERATVLVIGAQGEGLRSLLGTVATDALRHVTRPVLVVRKPERLRRVGSRPLRALVPFALDDTDPELNEVLSLVASTGDVDADCVHYLALPAPPSIGHVVPLDEESLRATFGDLPVGIRLRAILERDAVGRLDHHVADLARERDVDLVVCGSHHRRGIERLRQGSTAEGIVQHAPVSVLVARAPTALHQRLVPALETLR